MLEKSEKKHLKRVLNLANKCETFANATLESHRYQRIEKSIASFTFEE